MSHINSNKGSKRKGGAARLRDKKNKLLVESASTCYSLNYMFSKKTKMQLPTVEDSGNSDVTKNNDNLNVDTCISKCISETDVNINSGKDISEVENILHEVSDISQSKDQKPVQPIISIYTRNSENRSFSANYYSLFNWIEYSVSNNAVYCFPCRHFLSSALTRGQQLGNCVFVNKGFNSWSYKAKAFRKHASSENHKASVEKWNLYLDIKQNDKSVANLLVHSRLQEIKENREHVYFLLKTTLFLGKQGIPFRGHDEKTNSSNKGNFIELLESFGDDKMIKKLQSRYGHYTSHDYQNDFIHIIASSIKKNILSSINDVGAYAVLVDETKDASKKEQLSFLIRFVDKNLNIQEKTLGCYHMKRCDAQSLSDAILKIIDENKLDRNRCIAQCYDGASVMSGAFSGVQTRIANVIPQAIYVHCHAHRLNLCLVNSIQGVKAVVDFFDTVQGLYTFLMNGHTRYEQFIQIQKDKKIQVMHLERLVDTRWAYWYSSLQKVKKRYSEIKEVLTIMTLEGDQTARASGLLEEISSFKFILILNIMKKILKSINCLSNELQSTSIIYSKAMDLVKSTKDDLHALRNDEMYLKISEKSRLFASKNGLNNQEYQLKHKRFQRNLVLNKHLNDYYVNSTLGKTTELESRDSIKTKVYFAIIDRFESQLEMRFSEKNKELFKIFEIFDYSSPYYFNTKCPYLEVFIKHYKHFQINILNLSSEFNSAKSLLKNKDILKPDLYSIMNTLTLHSGAFIETIKILHIIITLPISTASNERFFSSLKRLKSYIRTTMSDDRLSDLMVIAVEKEDAGKVNLNAAVDEFAQLKVRRYKLI